MGAGVAPGAVSGGRWHRPGGSHGPARPRSPPAPRRPARASPSASKLGHFQFPNRLTEPASPEPPLRENFAPVPVSFPGFSQVALGTRSPWKGAERTNAHEVTCSFQTHKSLPWGCVGEFGEPGVMHTLLTHTDPLPAAGWLAQPPPAALSPHSSQREWVPREGSGLRVPVQSPVQRDWGTRGMQAPPRPWGAHWDVGGARPCPQRSSQWCGGTSEGTTFKRLGQAEPRHLLAPSQV